MVTLSRGIFVVVEGIDGSGKTTLAAALADYFTRMGVETVLTKEPGATHLGKKIRSLIETEDATLAPPAEYLLFAADRAQHIGEIVRPALAANKLVISDRLTDSSIAYQGYGNGVDHSMIETINTWTLQGVEIDFTFFLRISPEDAIKRILARGLKATKFETDIMGFLTRVTHGFDEIYRQNKKGTIHTLDAMQDRTEVFNQAQEIIGSWITHYQTS
jgi:dTMP kinase